MPEGADIDIQQPNQDRPLTRPKDDTSQVEVSKPAEDLIERIKEGMKGPNPDPKAVLKDIADSKQDPQQVDEELETDDSVLPDEIQVDDPISPEHLDSQDVPQEALVSEGEVIDREFQKLKEAVLTRKGNRGSGESNDAEGEEKTSLLKKVREKLAQLDQGSSQMSDREIRSLAKKAGVDNLERLKSLTQIFKIDRNLIVEEEQLNALRELANSEVDPLPVFEALSTVGLEFRPRIDSESGGVESVLRLLKAPHLDEALAVLNGISDSAPGYRMYRWDSSGQTELESLLALAESDYVPEYSVDFYEKVSTVSAAIRRDIKIDDLPKFEPVFNNPGKFNFLLTALNNGYVPVGDEVFKSLDELDSAGLIEPLTILLQSKISVGEIFAGTGNREGEQTQADVNRSLLEFVHNPSVQDLLSNSEKQEFARRLSELSKGKEIEVGQVDEFFDKREQIEGLYDLIFKGRDIGDREYVFDKGPFSTIVDLFQNKTRVELFLAPEFQEFVKNLDSSPDFKLQPGDFFLQQHFNEYDMRIYGDDSLLLGLFYARNVIDYLGQDSLVDIIQNSRSQASSELRFEAREKVNKYVKMIGFDRYVTLLKENSISVPNDADGEQWLRNVKNMRLLKADIVDGLSPEMKKRWIEAVLNIPIEFQNYTSVPFDRESDRFDVDIKTFNKIIELSNIISSSDFFSTLIEKSNVTLSVDLLQIDPEILRQIPARFQWLDDGENSGLAAFILNNSLLFMQSEEDLSFINQVVELAGQNSLSILTDYKKYIEQGIITPDDKSLFVDFAHIFVDPQSSRDIALRRGYKMMGDYLTIDSYRFLREVVNGSVDDQVLQSLGITQKGEEGLAQLESIMHGFVLGLESGNSDLSLLDHKIFSDFIKSYVRYESSQWGDHSSDNFSRIIQTAQRLKETQPGILDSSLPSSGIQDIAKLERTHTSESTFTEPFMSRYGTLRDNIQKALDAISQPRAFSSLARNIKIQIDEQIIMLESDLEKNRDKSQAQAHIQKRIERLKTVDPGDLKSFQANFAALAQEKVFSDLLMQSVFAYTLQKFPEQRERMARVIGKETPDVDSISAILDFTEHMTTKEAWKSYFTDKNAKRAFQSILDTKEINDGLTRLMEEGSKTRNYTPVEFVPTRGILMEFSGYIADACWASRYESSAEQFPNITAVIMQDVSKEVPKLLGSSLLIETTSTDGVPLLIIRGLNPLESYINHVDIPDFYGKFTDYVKRVAESQGRRAAIVIDNHSGGSSTNRPLLFSYLTEKKRELSPIVVPSEDTTFNGYNISQNTYLLN